MLADLCVIAVVAGFMYMGYKAGFMRSFVKIASYIVSIVISFFMYPVISDLLVKTPIYEKMVELINQKYQLQPLIDVPTDTFSVLANYIDKGVQAATVGIAEAIAVLLVNILAFVIVLILSKLVIRIVGSIFKIFTKLPVIKQFNRLGGMILGGISGVLVLYLVCAVMFLFSPLDPHSRIAFEIEQSTFASEIYENNIIINVLGK
ncbi:MAG: CvpA family protein [Ruminococcaceae bacterium]|nr:CvpA family protein [Oscillospiraceae bacterium]